MLSLVVSIYRVVMAMIIASISIGRSTSFAPDVAEAKISAKKLFSIIDRVPKIPLDAKNSKKPVSKYIIFVHFEINYTL